jgi:hypothetical protein
MESIDKNDVDISRLFQWKTKVSIEFMGKELDVYLRLIGDAETNRARVFALRKSAEMRKLLRDENSDEKLAYLPESGVVQKNELIQGLMVLYTKEAGNEAVKSLSYNIPTEPQSDDSLEKHEEHQQKIDEFPQWREDAIKEFITDRVTEYGEKLKNKSYDEIYEEYTYSLIDQLCELKMLTKYREMCVFYATYKDENLTERIFDTFDVLENLPGEVKNQLIDEYNTLEISGEDLKK